MAIGSLKLPGAVGFSQPSIKTIIITILIVRVLHKPFAVRRSNPLLKVERIPRILLKLNTFKGRKLNGVNTKPATIFHCSLSI